nr:NADH-dependent flavin oxidoreductase [Lactobacillus johnsonii]
MKSGGNKALLQIAHTGREANYRAHLGLPVYAPDSANYPFLPYGVQAFTTEQVEQVVKDFGRATKRAIEAGFDGVEIHGANHYLIQQFFSRFSNHRQDKWGDYEAFPLTVAKEVFKVVRKYAPQDFIIGYRISPEEINPGNVGYTWHESTKLINDLTNNFDFDYIHLSLPDYKAKPKDSDKTFAALFKPVIGKETKLIIVGDVMSQETAEDALKYTDLVAAGRAQIIDANFAAKVVAGKGDKVITELSDEEEKEQALTPGLREVMDKQTKRPNFAKMLQGLDYSKAIKVK